MYLKYHTGASIPVLPFQSFSGCSHLEGVYATYKCFLRWRELEGRRRDREMERRGGRDRERERDRDKEREQKRYVYLNQWFFKSLTTRN